MLPTCSQRSCSSQMDFQDIWLVLNGVLFSAGDFLFSWSCQKIASVFSKMHFIEAYSQNHEICNIWVTKTNTGSSWEQYRHSHGWKHQYYDNPEATCLCRLFKNECSLLLNTLITMHNIIHSLLPASPARHLRAAPCIKLFSFVWTVFLLTGFWHHDARPASRSDPYVEFNPEDLSSNLESEDVNL